MWVYARPVTPDELYHYGVRGMKWGVRRFQNSDGSLIGTKKQIRDVIADNKKAFHLGKKAAVSTRTTARLINKSIRLENKIGKQFDRNPNKSGKRLESLMVKDKAAKAAIIKSAYKSTKDTKEMMQHAKDLAEKYGSDVIKMPKVGTKKLAKSTANTGAPNKISVVNERVVNGKQIAASMLTYVGASKALSLGLPLAVVYNPPSASRLARASANSLYRNEYKKQKQRG